MTVEPRGTGVTERRGAGGADVTAQLRVVWQEPQSSVVTACCGCFPVAVIPL